MEENKKKIVDEFNYIINDDDDDEFYDSENLEENEDINDEEFENYKFEVAIALQTNLLDYVKYNGLPICEKLNLSQVLKFIDEL